MTTTTQETVKCAVCGRKSSQDILCSTNTFGAPDLDTRPAEMQRATILNWVQECPTCGYCAGDISQAGKKAGKTVKEIRYQQQLKHPGYPKLANRFLCHAFIALAEDEPKHAVWCYIHAAWACDDAKNSEKAMECRNMASDHIIELTNHGKEVINQPGGTAILLVDLLRRAERFPEALYYAQQHVDDTEDLIAAIFRLQMTLIEKQDTDCHTVDELDDCE